MFPIAVGVVGCDLRLRCRHDVLLLLTRRERAVAGSHIPNGRRRREAGTYSGNQGVLIFCPAASAASIPARFTLSKGLRARIFDLIFQGVSSFAHALRYGACAFV